MTTQLSVYNNALMLLGETDLASLTEARESRYLLDNVWNAQEGLTDRLSEGFWKFAIRATQWNNDPSVTPAFGLRFAFSLPTDYLRAYAICSDPYFNTPLLLYSEEGRQYMYADIQIIFLRYVSSNVNFGLNLANWTSAFTRFVEHYFAWRIAYKIWQNKEQVEEFEKGPLRRALVRARSLDAMESATEQPALGAWVRSRWGRNTSWDRGNPNRLIG